MCPFFSYKGVLDTIMWFCAIDVIIFHTQQFPYPPIGPRTNDEWYTNICIPLLLMLAFMYTFAQIVKVHVCMPFSVMYAL